jgi:hypothetical protein
MDLVCSSYQSLDSLDHPLEMQAQFRRCHVLVRWAGVRCTRPAPAPSCPAVRWTMAAEGAIRLQPGGSGGTASPLVGDFSLSHNTSRPRGVLPSRKAAAVASELKKTAHTAACSTAWGLVMHGCATFDLSKGTLVPLHGTVHHSRQQAVLYPAEKLRHDDYVHRPTPGGLRCTLSPTTRRWRNSKYCNDQTFTRSTQLMQDFD